MFAWFGATNAITVNKVGDITDAIKVAGTELSLNDALNVKLEFTTVTAPVELTASDGKVYYYIDATHVREKTGVETSDKIGSAAYTINWADTYAEEIRVQAATKSVTFNISATGRIHLVTSASDITALASNPSVTVTVQADGSLSVTSGTVFFRVDGGDKTNGSAVTQDESNVTEFGTIKAE